MQVMFVTDKPVKTLPFVRAFVEGGHRCRIFDDVDKAMAEIRHKPFKFDLVVLDLPPLPADEIGT